MSWEWEWEQGRVRGNTQEPASTVPGTLLLGDMTASLSSSPQPNADPTLSTHPTAVSQVLGWTHRRLRHKPWWLP